MTVQATRATMRATVRPRLEVSIVVVATGTPDTCAKYVSIGIYC